MTPISMWILNLRRSDPPLARPFGERFWDVPSATGHFTRELPATNRTSALPDISNDHGSSVIFRAGFGPTQTSLRSKLRPRLLLRTPFTGSGMPNHSRGVLLRAMSGTELSHVRTELERRRILTTIPPHPVQANPQLPPHRDFGNAPAPTHRQVSVMTSPLRIDSCCRLGCLHQQEAQQGIALLADVPQPLLASSGILARNHPHIRADLLATMKPRGSSDDKHVSECCERAHTGMGHQSQCFGSLPGFPLDGGADSRDSVSRFAGSYFPVSAGSTSRASSRSNFCFLTRLALISAGSPIHSSKPNSASNRSNQRE
jgi:hypothetical protein